jgi:potassium efflux system protein
MTNRRPARHKTASRFFLCKSLLLISLLFLVAFSEGFAAEAPVKSVESQSLANTSKFIKDRIKDVEGTADMEEGVKKRLLELYRQSLDNLETTTSQSALADKYTQSVEKVPAETKKIREEIKKASQRPTENLTDLPADADLTGIEQELLKAKTNFTTVEAKVSTLTTQLATQNERPARISQRLDETRKSEEELQVALKAPLPAEEKPQVTEALRWVQQTKLQALQSEKKALNQELVSMPVLLELAKAQQEEAAAQLEQAVSLVHGLEAKVNQRRQAEAAKTMEQAEEAMRQVADKPKVLQQAAVANTALGDELRSSTAAMESVTLERDSLAKEQKRLEERLNATKQKIDLAGLSQALGRVLYEQKRLLPNVRLLKKELAKNETKIAETGLNQFQQEEERKRISDVDSLVSELTAGISADEVKAIDTELRALLASRQELLDKIIVANQNFLGLLAERDIVYRQLLNTVTAYESFLSERLLWMRSTPPLQLKDFYGLLQEATNLLSPAPWLATLKMLAAQDGSLALLALAFLVTVVLLSNKKRLRTRIEDLVSQAGNPATYHFGSTIQALALGLLLAMPWPLLFAALGWQAQILADPTDFSRAVGGGFLKLAYRLYWLRAVSILVMPKGLAARFFHWSETSINMLRRESRFLIATFLPAVLITQIAYIANLNSSSAVPLGRVSFIVSLCFLAISLYRTLHPKTGIWQRFCRSQSHQLLARLYPAFFGLVMLLLPVVSILVMTGYVLGAGILMTKIIDTLWLTLGLVTFHQLNEHWLLQSSRKLAIGEAKKRRDAALHEEEDEEPTVTGKDASNEISAPVEDLATLSANSRKLLDTLVILAGFIGLGLVWGDVLPALRIFNEYALWHYAATVGGQVTQMSVSVGDALLAILIGIITMTLTRHFPALLEIVLLQHLEMAPGSRYTTKTLSRYVLGGIGASMVAGELGFSWGQIQWLVAALSVGIGFGLQEIVANFISGIIILFERPIRVGDVITIGTTDGVVTRIRIRATTIRDFDRKELLVPNKEFISGRLLNWSLSDPVIRLKVSVGIAYGSDVDKAVALMIAAACEDAMILADPKPIATFDSFGDNALTLTLRCFIGSVDNRRLAISALHHAINSKFRDAGVAIAFPQRDIHLDTSRPLDVKIHQGREVVLPHTGALEDS